MTFIREIKDSTWKYIVLLVEELILLRWHYANLLIELYQNINDIFLNRTRTNESEICLQP